MCTDLMFNTPTSLYLMLLAVTMSIFSLCRVLSTSAIISGVFDFFGAGAKFMPLPVRTFVVCSTSLKIG